MIKLTYTIEEMAGGTTKIQQYYSKLNSETKRELETAKEVSAAVMLAFAARHEITGSSGGITPEILDALKRAAVKDASQHTN